MGVSKWEWEHGGLHLREGGRDRASPCGTAKQERERKRERERDRGGEGASKWPLSGVEMPFPVCASVAQCGWPSSLYGRHTCLIVVLVGPVCAALFGV